MGLLRLVAFEGENPHKWFVCNVMKLVLEVNLNRKSQSNPTKSRMNHKGLVEGLKMVARRPFRRHGFSSQNQTLRVWLISLGRRVTRGELRDRDGRW